MDNVKSQNSTTIQILVRPSLPRKVRPLLTDSLTLLRNERFDGQQESVFECLKVLHADTHAPDINFQKRSFVERTNSDSEEANKEHYNVMPFPDTVRLSLLVHVLQIQKLQVKE